MLNTVEVPQDQVTDKIAECTPVGLVPATGGRFDRRGCWETLTLRNLPSSPQVHSTIPPTRHAQARVGALTAESSWTPQHTVHPCSLRRARCGWLFHETGIQTCLAGCSDIRIFGWEYEEQAVQGQNIREHSAFVQLTVVHSRVWLKSLSKQ